MSILKRGMVIDINPDPTVGMEKIMIPQYAVEQADTPLPAKWQ